MDIQQLTVEEELFIQSVQAGNDRVVEQLLQETNVDPSMNNNWAVITASENGHVELLDVLLDDGRVDPSANNNQALVEAATHGDLETVTLLLSDFRVLEQGVINALISATFEGQTDVIQWILENGEINADVENNTLIRVASELGYADIVELLLQYEEVDLGVDDYAPLREAVRNGHTAVVSLLLVDDIPDTVIESLIPVASDNGDWEIVSLLQEYILS